MRAPQKKLSIERRNVNGRTLITLASKGNQIKRQRGVRVESKN